MLPAPAGPLAVCRHVIEFPLHEDMPALSINAGAAGSGRLRRLERPQVLVHASHPFLGDLVGLHRQLRRARR